MKREVDGIVHLASRLNGVQGRLGVLRLELSSAEAAEQDLRSELELRLTELRAETPAISRVLEGKLHEAFGRNVSIGFERDRLYAPTGKLVSRWTATVWSDPPGVGPRNCIAFGEGRTPKAAAEALLKERIAEAAGGVACPS